MSNKKPTLIGSIEFKGINVNIYNDPDSDKSIVFCAWQMRNPDTCYQGIAYMDNNTGKISYPENAVIPIQTDKDREILPKFVVTGVRQIDDDFLALLISELEKGHMTRNGELK
mgnify:CR=1 FL=1